MSIKKLFDSANPSIIFEDYKNEKEMFEFVESRDNARQINIKNETFIPHLDYSQPVNFIRYGSAYYFYQGALKKISDYYPYDGSSAEKVKFYNSLFEGEKYVFDKRYPTTTGYVIMSVDGWGSLSGVQVNGYGMPATPEYITFKGGPLTASGTSMVSRGPDPDTNKVNYSNIYDENIYQTAGLPDDYGKGTRLSNLRSNFDDGVTAEFWLKKTSFDLTKTGKEVVADIWNNYSLSTGKYGRITLELTGGFSGNTPFMFTVQSGTTSVALQRMRIGNNITPASLKSWGHYAFTFQNSGSSFVVKLYENGVLNDTNVYNGNISELNSKGMMGRLGGLMRPPSGSAIGAGAGKLSASLDEFRFWKVVRNSQQISRNWFAPVNGGTNTDISNTTLGVYYKFNEGIVGSSSIDSMVLDYSGRLSNGVWTGYSATSRNTGSAIVSASAARTEAADPIIRVEHPKFIALSSSLLATGSYYDLNNNSSFMSYVPSWIIEEHEALGNPNIKIISHILGSYFDKLYFLIKEVPKIRESDYITSSVAPVPFARHLPQSLGLYTPNTFIDADIVEKLLNRDATRFFEGDLVEAKNEIYVNLYNNLAEIFKSKGTGRAIRNVLRCFNLDDSLLQFRQYSTGETYSLANNLRQKQYQKTFLNNDHRNNLAGVVYQCTASSNSDSRGYISGSYESSIAGAENPYGATIEADIMFPTYNLLSNTFRRQHDLSKMSLFGMYTANTGSARALAGANTAFVSSSDYSNFQVYAQRATPRSKDVQFILSSSRSPYPIPLLTSSVFFNVYDNNLWNLSVRLRPQGYPMAAVVSGSIGYGYDVVFRGTNYILDTELESFEVSSSISHEAGTRFLQSAKRLYVGAHRDNLTGTISQSCDVTFSSVKYWTKYLDNYSLRQHSRNSHNSGISGSYRNISPLDPNNKNKDLLNLNTLALEWNFSALSKSTTHGKFFVEDYSSGSATMRNNYGWLGKVSGYQHTGRGFSYATSSTDIASIKSLNVYEFIDPEQVVSDEMIRIVSGDEEVFDLTHTVPDYLFTLEKSMYGAVSAEMLNFFAGVIDFNSLIGDPVNRYRERYKDLEKLREIFFRRVTKVTDVEKFLNYYKWFDDAISMIIQQLVPGSSPYVENILNMIEPHVLERSKYQTKFPTLEFKEPEIEFAPFKGIWEKTYSWKFGHSPLPSSPRDTEENILYWKNRAQRWKTELKKATNGPPDAIVNEQREKVRKAVVTNPHVSSSIPKVRTRGGMSYQAPRYPRRNFQKPYRLGIQTPGSASVLYGGVNFEASKNIHFTYNALTPAGPVNTDSGVFVPENVLMSFMSSLTKIPPSKDPKPAWVKTKRYSKVLHGRDYESGLGYKNVKSSIAFPFNLYDSSDVVKAGYQAQIRKVLSGGITITNLHNDVYGPYILERPMQGPFTEYAVGGHQSRHITINKGADTWKTRPEAWKLLLACCTDLSRSIEDSGAIGLVGADYPYPGSNGGAEGDIRPYPQTASQKAVYYRDFVSKRPVNIRNIHHTTGSTILGNYNNNYDFLNTVGAYSNPRQFVEKQPQLPNIIFENSGSNFGRLGSTRTLVDRGPTSVRNLLNIRRSKPFKNVRYSHFNFLSSSKLPARINGRGYPGEYSVGYLTGAKNKSVIRGRFAAPGGIEIATPGYNDFRSDSYSVYNSVNNRNLMVKRPFQAFPQNKSFISAEITGAGPAGISVFDIHGKDYGLYAHLTRHSAKFGRSSVWITGSHTASSEPFPGALATGGSLTTPGGIGDGTQITITVPVSAGGAGKAVTIQFTTSDSTGAGAAGANKIGIGTPAIFTTYRNAEYARALRDAINGAENSLVTYATSGEGIKGIGVKGVSASPKGDLYGFTNVAVRALYAGTAGNSITMANVVGTSLVTVGTFTSGQNKKKGLLTYGGPGKTYNQLPSFHKVNRNNLTVLKQSHAAAGLAQYSPSSVYDNWYITHQIPRSTLQYAWITASCQYRRDGAYGMVSSDFLTKDSTGKWIDSLDFVSASEFVSYINAAPRAFGWDYSGVFANRQAQRTDFVGLNLNTLETCNTGSGILGKMVLSALPGGEGGFLNHPDLAFRSLNRHPGQIATINTAGTASALNAILLNRQSVYGWPTWRQMRWADHKLLRTYKKHNAVYMESITGAVASTTKFIMPPVSMRGRPLYVSLEVDENTQVWKADYSNNYVYFNRYETDDQFPDFGRDYTSTTVGEQIIDNAVTEAFDSIDLNWILYTENIFPSQRNEFLNHSRNKKMFDNRFWRDSQNARVTLGTTISSSQDIVPLLTQSCFVLDAPLNFLTRRMVPLVSYSLASGQLRGREGTILRNRKSLVDQATAGELQNTYSTYFTSSNIGHLRVSNYQKANVLTPGLLYARKHTISTPTSVVCPAGINIPQSGSGKMLPFASTKQIQVFAGEAQWQAGSQAGYMWYDLDAPHRNYLQFISKPSKPWFNNYEEFNYLLNKVSKAKEFAIVPEYRMSVHIEDYSRAGWSMTDIQNKKYDMLEFPETRGCAETQQASEDGSSAPACQNSQETYFYVDYSNSEFLQNYGDLKWASGLEAKQIKIECSASIRFNPYKGFYPVQRTIQLAHKLREELGLQTSWDAAGAPYYNNPPWYIDGLDNNFSGSLTKPLFQPMFAPGIMFNTIKSGLAVDFPVVEDPRFVQRTPFGDSAALKENNYAITIDPTAMRLQGMRRNALFDRRIPFEAMINPDLGFMGSTALYVDLDSHPSCSIDLTSSGTGDPLTGRLIDAECAETSYGWMADNFFGEIMNTYLADGQPTQLKSDGWPRAGQTIEVGTYMMRIKLRRSMEGIKSYSNERGSKVYLNPVGTYGGRGRGRGPGGTPFNFSSLSPYVQNGGRRIFSGTQGSGRPANAKGKMGFSTSSIGYPIPQDPFSSASSYRETFTMYSRPTAFGPPLAGMGEQSKTSVSRYMNNTIVDSFSGHNPAYTPPYYDGESWCDVVFRVPESMSDHKYTMTDIINNCKHKYWRIDPGYATASYRILDVMTGRYIDRSAGTTLVYDDSISLSLLGLTPAPYSGNRINEHCMQISASIRINDMVTAPKVEIDTGTTGTVTIVETDSWVIRPRMETPMMNFNDKQLQRPLTSSELAIPQGYGAASVPRGMWHQFGVLERDPTKGVFLEVEDMPLDWLNNHYDVYINNSIYNDYNAKQSGSNVILSTKSLIDLVGFDSDNRSTKLGKLKTSLTINEAVVAIPYIVEGAESSDGFEAATAATMTSPENMERKKFISIPESRIEAAVLEGTTASDSLDAAGESIRRQIELMRKYIFPPNLDWVNFPAESETGGIPSWYQSLRPDWLESDCPDSVTDEAAAEPFVAYIFEFSYDFSEDDLSYMWQNLAPPEYKKITLQNTAVAHELIDSELLSETNLADNESLRWMVFKVKQRSQVNYYDHYKEIGTYSAYTEQCIRDARKFGYNWPYDYLSFVEKIKIDVKLAMESPFVDGESPMMGADDESGLSSAGPAAGSELSRPSDVGSMLSHFDANSSLAFSVTHIQTFTEDDESESGISVFTDVDFSQAVNSNPPTLNQSMWDALRDEYG